MIGWRHGWQTFKHESGKGINEDHFDDFPMNRDTPAGARLMNKVSNESNVDSFVRAYQQGRIDASKKVSRDKNPYVPTKDKWLIRGWDNGWIAQTLKTNTPPQELKAASQKQVDDFSRGYEQGRIDGANKITRDKNPFAKTGNIWIIQGWFDGWDVQNKRGLREKIEGEGDEEGHIELDPDELDTPEGARLMQRIARSRIYQKLDDFTVYYLIAALRSTVDKNTGEKLSKYGIESFDDRSLDKAIRDCKEFQKEYKDKYQFAHWTDSEAGADFWFSRNNTEIGFASKKTDNSPLNEKMIANELERAARDFGHVEFYLKHGVIYSNPS